MLINNALITIGPNYDVENAGNNTYKRPTLVM